MNDAVLLPEDRKWSRRNATPEKSTSGAGAFCGALMAHGLDDWLRYSLASASLQNLPFELCFNDPTSAKRRSRYWLFISPRSSSARWPLAITVEDMRKIRAENLTWKLSTQDEDLASRNRAPPVSRRSSQTAS